MINKTMISIGLLIEIGFLIYYREVSDDIRLSIMHSSVCVALLWVWISTKSFKQVFKEMKEMEERKNEG